VAVEVDDDVVPADVVIDVVVVDDVVVVEPIFRLERRSLLFSSCLHPPLQQQL
jgi:hypothetical protein